MIMMFIIQISFKQSTINKEERHSSPCLKRGASCLSSYLVKKELDAIFEKIETQNKVNNREKMIVAWQLGRIPYKDFDVVYDLLKKKN